MDFLSPARRIRLHERLQQACALIDQVWDDLPHDDELRAELRDARDRVWGIGYELVAGLEDLGEGSIAEPVP